MDFQKCVLYLDNHLLVCCKPTGILSQGDITGDPDMLTLAKRFIKNKFSKPGNVFIGLVHRLDRPVSGVMVFARTSKAATRLTAQFKERSVAKSYVALVEGRLAGGGEMVDFIEKRNQRAHIVDGERKGARIARLHWQTQATKRNISLVNVQPVTGRSHQIRVQFANAGYPLLGDFKYGAHEKFDGRNLALHSHTLTFSHPTTKEQLTFSAAPPESWHVHFSPGSYAFIPARAGQDPLVS